ncbi:FAD/NAD(P)-binding protein [Oryzifoliimicrobium ureilyticus]|uniref:FAD/NAD(P)-binding protein n=1 Tax=Oryzifoliimicrobium ureilyticus TaxID=3113724 RepID=UPI00307605ED
MLYDVLVVGSGFSAIAVACNLIESLPPDAAIGIVGDDPGFGRGTAYRTELYLHRLNVPAARMSLFPDRPDDFVAWLERHGRHVKAGDFASRADYGLYVRDSLAGILRPRASRCRVDFIKAKATGCIERYAASTAFSLDNGDQIAGRYVVLCLGLGNAPLPLAFDGLTTSMRSKIVKNPWRLSWLRRVAPHDDVTILGSGLTMIDQVLALRARGHKGNINVLSRRGLAPLGHHRNHSPATDPRLPPLPWTISKLLRHLRDKASASEDWRSVMDGLRPITQKIWQQLDPVEKSRFLRHALPWWNIHRHRVAPDVFDRFQALRDQAVLKMHAGYLTRVDQHDDRLEISYRKRRTQIVESFSTDIVVNCTGMERAGIDHSPLLKEMRNLGMIEADPLGLGIAVDRDSRILASDGIVQKNIYAVGALTAGQFWEITAVPDIRVQARHVSLAIASAYAR